MVASMRFIGSETMKMKKNKDNQYQFYIDSLNNFRKCLRDVFVLKEELDEIVRDADFAMGDCRHKLELDYPNSAKERTKICRAIQKSGQERRIAKNCLMVLDEFIKFAESKNTLPNELDAIYGKMQKAKKTVEGPRSYRTRILSDLFGEDIIGKGGTDE